MVSAKGVLRCEGFPYALDNGAWTAHQAGRPFDVDAFERAVRLMGDDADFVVLPDIVGGGLRSLELSLAWLPKLRHLPLLLPVQDGIEPRDVCDLVSRNVGLFLGGSTQWKLATAAQWGRCAREWRCHLHVGRVNTVRRVAICAAAGAHSFDGSSVTRYSANLPRLDNARRQPDMFNPHADAGEVAGPTAS